MFHQTFEPHDLLVICVLIVLEGILSIDNALVLGILARRLPEALRAKALTYGLVGALVFRVVVIASASVLLRWRGAELIGGAYLLFTAIRRLSVRKPDRPVHRRLEKSAVHNTHELSFWLAVVSIELTDVAFAIDSIVAALALVGRAPSNTPTGQLHPKLWVVAIGGMGGLIMMRFAAMLFVKLLDRFPRFEVSAYLLVIVIGTKMLVSYFLNANAQAPRVNFQSPSSAAFWIFWGLMAGAIAWGFAPARTMPPLQANENPLD
jgi:YkoY family integral membrane protein